MVERPNHILSSQILLRREQEYHVRMVVSSIRDFVMVRNSYRQGWAAAAAQTPFNVRVTLLLSRAAGGALSPIR